METSPTLVVRQFIPGGYRLEYGDGYWSEFTSFKRDGKWWSGYRSSLDEYMEEQVPSEAHARWIAEECWHRIKTREQMIHLVTVP